MKKVIRFTICILVVATACKTSRQTVGITENKPKVEPSDSLSLPVTQIPEIAEVDSSEVLVETKPYVKDTFTLVGVGDIMVGTIYPKNYLPSDNGTFLWDDSRSYFQEADIAFGNLEGTVLDGEGEPKECKNPDACFLFKMPSRLASNFADCGFDLMSIANNHANDFGIAGRKSTQKTLDSLHIAHAGSSERPFGVYEISGLKVGFVAFAPNRGTLTFYDADRAAEIVAQLKDSADVVLVSIHGGAEGVQNLHVTRKREFYFGEDRGNIYEFSHRMIDAGADVILGHGPHVPRAVEVYKNRFIAYSLGNFCTYGRFNLRAEAGIAPLIKLRINREGKFIDGEIVSFRQSYAYGPLLDDTREAARLIRELSIQDFPENPITIDEVGKIIYIQN